MPNIFEKRTAFKPFEYKEIIKFKEAIDHSYWLVSEWNFISDVQDFHVKLNDTEREAIKRAMLAISQIEISVKKFWANLGSRFPKAEFDQVGIVFAASEVRHADAYSHLLEILGFNSEFANLLEVPEIQGRVDYLTKYLKGAADNSDENYSLTLALFSLFIENVSLFSQFAIIKSFNKHKNVLKDIDNVIQATQKEETIHALFGIEVINIIRRENPEWFNEHFYDKIYRACHKAYIAEAAIVDWIFGAGEIPFCTVDSVKEFIKIRLNESLKMIGGKPQFEIDPKYVKEWEWFNEEILADVSVDFFHKKSTAYSKFSKSVTAGDLF